MKIFECPKCKSRDVFINKSGNNTGLYCGDCGAWIKWLNKDELRIANIQIKNNKANRISDVLKSLSNCSVEEMSNEFKRIGIHVENSDGTYRSIYDILNDVSLIYS